MTPPHPDPALDTRHRLEEAALLVFAKKGFDGAGLREIAGLAKANIAMIQYHFGGKEGLYREALRYAFGAGPCHLMSLPKPPNPDAPGAVELAKKSLRTFIHNFLDEFFLCTGTGTYLPVEVERAAKILWGREMQEPRPNLEDFILESIQPYRDYLDACILALRPDLDAEGQYRMGMCIQAQILFIYKHMEMIRLTRGKAYTPADIDSLTEHLTQFSLRGLGFPDALSGV
jgi:AcrR family transcriptional regulator